MQVSVVGCGYLGAVHAASMAALGHQVVGLDVDADKVAKLAGGVAPFFEPGFDEILREQVSAGRLTFSTDPAAIADADVHFIAVGTPQQAGRLGADLTYLAQAVDAIVTHSRAGRRSLVVGKSTVPVGSAQDIADRLAAERPELTLVWNPEFLREGFAVNDTLHPDRIVYGLPADHESAHWATERLDECYRQILTEGMPRLLTNYPTAELVKVAANSFLATKISFINAMSELCDATGADVVELAQAIGYDDRIGPKFLRAGIGFGGGCLPKDIRAFMARAGELGVAQALTFLREVDSINRRRREHAVHLASDLFGGRLVGVRVAVLGAAFKPNSDDLRDSPALEIATRLWSRGADVAIYDPAAGDRLREQRPDLEVAASVDEACRAADLVMLLTEWDEFKNLDPASLGDVVARRNIIDGRNALDPRQWANAGWTYQGMGRRG